MPACLFHQTSFSSKPISIAFYFLLLHIMVQPPLKSIRNLCFSHTMWRWGSNSHLWVEKFLLNPLWFFWWLSYNALAWKWKQVLCIHTTHFRHTFSHLSVLFREKRISLFISLLVCILLQLSYYPCISLHFWYHLRERRKEVTLLKSFLNFAQSRIRDS